MSEGDGMAEVTEADWLRAHAVLREWLSAVPAVEAQVRTTGAQKELERAIAAALAEEREKARAPFAALAQELATVATYHHATVAGDAYADAADRIVAVLEGTYR